ncbi:SGNH hydrolase-type esterase domain-containing protein, partial [Lophiotrema nucula]
GYVAFGDSYGAGLGTGTTTTDACRVGSNNFADLLMRCTQDNSIDYQRMVCYGATIVGLNRQIDEWKTPEHADIATVSMGGNDLGFSHLVYHCITTPNPFRWVNRGKCVEAQNLANTLLNDVGANGLRANLIRAYKRILENETFQDFHVYVTGYLQFFN